MMVNGSPLSSELKINSPNGHKTTKKKTVTKTFQQNTWRCLFSWKHTLNYKLLQCETTAQLQWLWVYQNEFWVNRQADTYGGTQEDKNKRREQNRWMSSRREQEEMESSAGESRLWMSGGSNSLAHTHTHTHAPLKCQTQFVDKTRERAAATSVHRSLFPLFLPVPPSVPRQPDISTSNALTVTEAISLARSSYLYLLAQAKKKNKKTKHHSKNERKQTSEESETFCN